MLYFVIVLPVVYLLRQLQHHKFLGVGKSQCAPPPPTIHSMKPYCINMQWDHATSKIPLQYMFLGNEDSCTSCFNCWN